MAESLAAALAQLKLGVEDISASDFDRRLAEEENGIYEDHRPRKRAPQNVDDIKAELESDFLTPSPRFTPEWLNRLQMFVAM